jgi:hypothetical protein
MLRTNQQGIEGTIDVAGDTWTRCEPRTSLHLERLTERLVEHGPLHGEREEPIKAFTWILCLDQQTCLRAQVLDTCDDDRFEECLFRRKVPMNGTWPHPSTPSDLVKRDRKTHLREGGSSRLQHPLAVASRVDPRMFTDPGLDRTYRFTDVSTHLHHHALPLSSCRPTPRDAATVDKRV